MKFKDFMKAIDSGVKHVYLLSGEETFYIDKAREKILDKLNVDKADIVNVNGSDKIPIAEIINTIDSAPFFSDKNVVVVKNAPYFSAEVKSERFENVLQNMLDSNYVIFIAKTADKRRKLYKIIDKVGAILEAEPLKAWQIDEWLDDKLKSIGKVMYGESRKYFAERIGMLPEISLWYLENEFSKLALNVFGREIKLIDLQRNLLEMPEISNFAITDAIDTRKTKTAVEILRRSEKNLHALTAVLVQHVRKLIRAKYFINSGTKGRALAEKLEMHPYIAQKFEKTAATYNVKLLENTFIELADADYKLKLGRAGTEILERIVIKLCRRTS